MEKNELILRRERVIRKTILAHFKYAAEIEVFAELHRKDLSPLQELIIKGVVDVMTHHGTADLIVITASLKKCFPTKYGELEQILETIAGDILEFAHEWRQLTEDHQGESNV